MRVSAGPVRVAARAASGVRAAGAPARFATEGRTVTRVVGNTLVSCRADRPGCLRTRERAGTGRDNDRWEMSAVDADDDPTTLNSSAARLDLPAGGQVVWAGLYWSATGRAADAGTIKVRPPGHARYTRVRAAEVTAVRFPAGPGYQAFADVTRLAVGGAGGRWWVADARFVDGLSRHAGWSLVVIATAPRRPYGQTVVLDAAAMAGRGHGEVAIPLSGLAPADSPAQIHLVTWAGDADLTGDRVRVGTTALRPVGGDRDAANPFDGSALGAVGATMTFGVDVDLFRPVLRPESVLRVTSREDTVLVGVAVVSVRTR